MADATPLTDPEMEAAIEQIFAEISQLNGLIRQEQAAIDRLKAESKVITDHTDAVLSRLRVQLDTLERTA
ncbi:MAG TPA: hypothetical protein VFA07_03290 [Chthonomonadaceae bacterium]|nr:hypothetical protein [Chthonomonadaceae bacterium]